MSRLPTLDFEEEWDSKDDDEAGQPPVSCLPTPGFEEERDSKSEAETPETTTEQAHPSDDSEILYSHPPPLEFPIQKTASSDPTSTNTAGEGGLPTVGSARSVDPPSTESSTQPLSVSHELDVRAGNATGCRVQKIHMIDLKGCECALKVSQTKIDEGDSVMMCKVPGCETVWVSRTNLIHSKILTNIDDQFHRECMNHDFALKNWACPCCKAGGQSKHRRT